MFPSSSNDYNFHRRGTLRSKTSSSLKSEAYERHTLDRRGFPNYA